MSLCATKGVWILFFLDKTLFLLPFNDFDWVSELEKIKSGKIKSVKFYRVSSTFHFGYSLKIPETTFDFANDLQVFRPRRFSRQKFPPTAPSSYKYEDFWWLSDNFPRIFIFPGWSIFEWVSEPFGPVKEKLNPPPFGSTQQKFSSGASHGIWHGWKLGRRYSHHPRSRLFSP